MLILQTLHVSAVQPWSHALQDCICCWPASISLLCSRLCPPIRDEPTIALVEMSNSIWKPIPIQMVPKSKSIWQPEPIDLNNGNLLRTIYRLTLFEPKFMEAKGRNIWTWVWRTSGNSWQLSTSSKCSCQREESTTWKSLVEEKMKHSCSLMSVSLSEAILFPMDDLQLAFSNVPTIFTA